MLHLRRWADFIQLKIKRADYLMTLDPASIADLNSVEEKMEKMYPSERNQTDELARIWESTPDEMRIRFLLDPVGVEVESEGEEMWEMERERLYQNDYISTASLCKSHMCGGRCRCPTIPQRSVEEDIVEYYRDEIVDKLEEVSDDESLQEAIHIVEKETEATEKQHKDVQAVMEDWGVPQMLQERKDTVRQCSNFLWSSLLFKVWRRNVGLKR